MELIEHDNTPAVNMNAQERLLAKRLLRRWDVLLPRLRLEPRLWAAALRLLERYAEDLRRQIRDAEIERDMTNAAA